VSRPTAVAGALLALEALAESIARAVNAGDGVSAMVALCLLALATTLPLALLRPLAAAATIAAAAVVSVAPFHRLTIGGAVAVIAVLYAAGRREVRLATATLFSPFVVLAFADAGHGEGRALTIALAVLAPAAAWAGAATQSQSQARAHRAAREVIADSSLEHAARGERARIARELHDVVAHHISMVSVQAESARLTTPGMPAAGAQRLTAIGDTARTALTEMRRLLGVLREDTDAEAAERRPQPGLAQLNELLDDVRAASGGGARLIVHGTPVALDQGVELAAYRITQEALTNSRRHAPGAAVDVELHYQDDALSLRVRDNGPGPPVNPPTGGLGLTGMTERATAVGGTLRTGVATGGGFLVEASLPAKAEVAR
jgi:signal transduction histidine kinase